MKILQANVLGHSHIEKIVTLIKAENPDAICLQEADHYIIDILTELGYETSFLPYLKRVYGENTIEEGVVIAARNLSNVSSVYYHMPALGIQVQEHSRHRDTTANGYIIGDVHVDGQDYTIATTHFTWSPRGELATPAQVEDMSALLEFISRERAHLLCGDFNIPRYHNSLYKRIVEHYNDAIPQTYKSSLDKLYHRLGNVLSRSHLFTDFMVDYIFIKPPYIASDVKLHFGVSDHAAVTATITKSTN